MKEIAPDVKNFKVGDVVCGVGGGIKGTIGGALAECLLVDAQLVSLMPTNLSFTEAATLRLVSITAWEALFDKMKKCRIMLRQLSKRKINREVRKEILYFCDHL